jgi:hypothetical protein
VLGLESQGCASLGLGYFLPLPPGGTCGAAGALRAWGSWSPRHLRCGGGASRMRFMVSQAPAVRRGRFAHEVHGLPGTCGAAGALRAWGSWSPRHLRCGGGASRMGFVVSQAPAVQRPCCERFVVCQVPKGEGHVAPGQVLPPPLTTTDSRSGRRLGHLPARTAKGNVFGNNRGSCDCPARRWAREASARLVAA